MRPIKDLLRLKVTSTNPLSYADFKKNNDKEIDLKEAYKDALYELKVVV